MVELTKILSRNLLAEKVAIVIGTRPGIIKMSPLYHEAKRRCIEPLLIHTGQHFSFNMDKAIMADCELPEPDYHIKLDEDERTHARQTAKMMVGVEDILLKERPKLILVCGDANTNFAAAVAARKLHIAVGHVEAGLRSHDWAMPEEHNRVMIDHISEYLFAPTEECRENLQKENVKGEIHVVGNTIVDVVFSGKRRAEKRSKILQELSLVSSDYVLLTLHREENVDSPVKCEKFVQFLETILPVIKHTIVYPIHPRSRMRFEQYGLMGRLLNTAKVIDPVSYLDFLMLETNGHIIMTDSGGLQEEACILGVPCFTLRENTERWETVEVGANHIVGFDSDMFKQAYNQVKKGGWENPFGDGHTSKKIFDVIVNLFQGKTD